MINGVTVRNMYCDVGPRPPAFVGETQDHRGEEGVAGEAQHCPAAGAGQGRRQATETGARTRKTETLSEQ